MRRERRSTEGEVDAETDTDPAEAEVAAPFDFVQADDKTGSTRRQTTALYTA
jgi:hypothetical protein